METQAAFVWPQHIGVLDAPPEVDLDAALIVDPLDTEPDHAVGDQQTLEHACILVRLVPLDDRADRLGDLFNSRAVQRAWVDSIDQ